MMLPKELLKDLETGNRTMDFVLEKNDSLQNNSIGVGLDPVGNTVNGIWFTDTQDGAMEQLRQRVRRMEEMENRERIQREQREMLRRMGNAVSEPPRMSYQSFSNFNEF